ncbi:Integrator complex subunit 6 [Eumeta japonica]|uniref:Integrator complex subunit 6 n=1 Tax=Eumeta variegata TaxID=151549 RepID=A0A4C2AJC7_EUMVA|nr:Integrator complex subunit 6 [Eumeta japonica]
MERCTLSVRLTDAESGSERSSGMAFLPKPPRSAHPAVKFTCSSQEPMVIDNLPFDKYELEPSPLTQYILARKQPTICWQVFVANSGCKNSEVNHPFGYLKASTNLTCVNLFVLPYNYPVLLPLLDELFKVHRCKPTPEWKFAFQQYLERMPSYYVVPLRRALLKMGAPAPLLQSLIPDTQDNSLSFSVLNYLKRLKNQAKIEFEKLCADVINRASSNTNQKVTESVRVVPRSPLKKELTTHPCLQDKFTALRDQLNEFGGFVVGLSRARHKSQAHAYRNPFDIKRRDLLDQAVRMRANFLQPSLAHTRLVDEDSVHSMPVAQMGNYQEYLKRMTPQLREIESQPVRQHMFGNPFKIDKRMMVDEADIDPMGSVRGGSQTGAGGKRAGEPLVRAALPPKRKAGPLPQHVQVRRPSSPAPPSPVPSPPTTPTSRRPAALLAPLAMSPVPSELPSGRPPEEPPVVDTGGATPVAAAPAPAPLNLPPVVKPFLNGDAYTTVGCKMPRSPSPPLESAQIVPGLVPIVAPAPFPAPAPAPASAAVSVAVAASASTSVSTSVPSSIVIPPSAALDAQESQINAILQGIAAENNSNARTRKRRKSKSESKPTLSLMATPPPPPSPPPPPPPPSAPAAPSRKELNEIRKHNLNVRSEVYRAIRRPGRDFTSLFDNLKQLRGSADIKKQVLREIIDESLRFKRKPLAKLLEDFVTGLEKNGNSAPVSVKKEIKNITKALYSNTNSHS